MTTKTQQIYGRWYYYVGDTTADEIFAYYEPFKAFNKNGTQVGGISCGYRTNDKVMILMTYDEESELMLTLKFAGNVHVGHKSIIPINTI